MSKLEIHCNITKRLSYWIHKVWNSKKKVSLIQVDSNSFQLIQKDYILEVAVCKNRELAHKSRFKRAFLFCELMTKNDRVSLKNGFRYLVVKWPLILHDLPPIFCPRKPPFLGQKLQFAYFVLKKRPFQGQKVWHSYIIPTVFHRHFMCIAFSA